MVSFNKFISTLLFITIAIASIWIQSTNAVTCYDCTNCPSPFNASILGINRVQCSGACRKTVTTQSFQASVINKRCDTACTELNSGLLGLGTLQLCCYSDLCNSAQAITSLYMPTLLSSIVILLFRK